MNTTVSVRYNDQKLSIFGHYYKALKATFFEPAEDETFVLLCVDKGLDVCDNASTLLIAWRIVMSKIDLSALKAHFTCLVEALETEHGEDGLCISDIEAALYEFNGELEEIRVAVVTPCRKFKIGDKVRVVKPVGIEYEETYYSVYGEFKNSWVYSMDEYRGVKTTIKDVHEINGYYLDVDNGGFGYLPEWLELVERVK